MGKFSILYRGTLRQAIKAKQFQTDHSEDPSLQALKYEQIIYTLLEIAQAILNVHSKRIIHCDLKPANVLLKSSQQDQRGFTALLTDFGLSKILMDTDSIKNQTGSGTITHIAPELMKRGAQLTTSIDTYAFGIIMWEIITALSPYKDMKRDEIMVQVAHYGLRPLFPLGTPTDYQSLAERCWTFLPKARPLFADIVRELQKILSKIEGSQEPVVVQKLTGCPVQKTQK